MQITVFSYNVCWECMDENDSRGSARKYGAACKRRSRAAGIAPGRPGVCKKTVIGNTTLVPHTFIGLQEASLKLAEAIAEKMLSVHGVTYEILGSHPDRTSSAFLLFRTDMTSVRTDLNGDRILLSGNVLREAGRPFIAGVFRVFNPGSPDRYRTLVVSSMHGGHLDVAYFASHMRYVLDELNVLTDNARMFNPNVFALPAIVMGDFNQKVSATKVKSKHSRHYQVDVKCGSLHDQLVAYRSPIYTPLLDLATCCIGDPDNPTHKYDKKYDNIVITPGACKVLGAARDQNYLGIRRIKDTLRHSSDHMPVAARLTVKL